MKPLATILGGALALVACGTEHVSPEYDAKIFHVSAAETDPCGKARAFVQDWRAQNGGRLPRGGVIVEFADGVYPLTSTWTLDASDSGTPACPILYRAAHPGKAAFIGARPLDWQPLGEAKGLPPSADLLPSASREHVLTTVVPDGEEVPGFFGASCYTQDEQLERPDYEFPLALYQNRRRLPNARWPDETCAKVEEIFGNVKTSWIYRVGSSQTFGARGPDGRCPPLADWAREPDLYLHGAWRLEYVDTAARPAALDVEKGLITIDRRDSPNGVLSGAEFHAFNAVSALDREGEWALDRKARRIYAWPFAGTGRPVLACTKTLLALQDVTDVEFEGFAFEGVRSHAVVLRNCRNIALRTSLICNTTGWGVRVEGGRSCRIEGCDLYDLGEGGVWLEGGVIDTLTHSEHVCDNCHIRDYAKLVWNYNPGVSLFGCGNEATHNLIHTAPHQACFFYGAENRFAWNIAHDVCKFTNDAGAIYSYNTHNAWSHRGNVIEYNVFHCLVPPTARYSQLDGIYIDSFTSGTVVRGNITTESSNPIFSSGGQDNLIERNVVVNARNESIRRWNLGLLGGKKPFWHYIWGKTNDCTRASYLMKPLIDKGELYGMAFWENRFPNMLKPLDFKDPALGHCAHFCRIIDNVLVAGPPVRVLDAEVTSNTTVVAGNVSFPGDPGFIDYEGMDWELRPDSPARQTLDGGTRFREMGLYDSPKRISPAVKFGADVTRPKKFNRHASEAIRRGVRYEDTFRSRFWLWCRFEGTDPDIPALCRQMDVPNACVIHNGAVPGRPNGNYAETLRDLDHFSWSLGADDTGRTFAQKLVNIIDFANMYPRMTTAWLDDGWSSEEGSLAALIAFKRDRLSVTGQKVKLAAVWRDDVSVEEQKPVLNLCDEIGFWMDGDVSRLAARLDRCRATVGNEKPILLGVMPATDVGAQLRVAERMLRTGKAAGIVFHDRSEASRQWIARHGKNLLR